MSTHCYHWEGGVIAGIFAYTGLFGLWAKGWGFLGLHEPPETTDVGGSLHYRVHSLL